MTHPFVKTAVIGHPIAHSKSPLIHNFWIEQHGLSGLYKAIDIAPDDLKSGVERLIDEGYAGFNVSVPHKVAIMPLCDVVDENARAIGAVNTVVIKDGKLHGSNTDAYGFSENLKHNTPEEWGVSGKRALVLGAGGAAKAIVHALLQSGIAHISITNRTQSKTEQFLQFDPERIHVVDWGDRHTTCANVDLIVNTTSLGMAGKPALDINLTNARAGMVVHDIVYAPLMTDLLSQAQNLSLPYVTGIGMLLHQARPGFELWNGVMPEVTPELERLVLS